MTIADKLRSLPPREICEHGSQKVKCPICEAAEAQEYILMLERALYAALHNVDVGFDPHVTVGDIEFKEMDDGHLIARRKR